MLWTYVFPKTDGKKKSLKKAPIALYISPDQYVTLLQLSNAKTIESKTDPARVKSLHCYS